jgi:hypothetical protein
MTVALALVSGPAQQPPEPREDRMAAAVQTAQARFQDGTAEGVVNGVALGGVAGFLVAATVQSAKRLDQPTSVPWLLISMPLGGVLGGALAGTLVYVLEPGAGDTQLVTSAAWVGTIAMILAEISIFQNNSDITKIPWMFGLGLVGMGGAAAIASGAAALFPISEGDVALATSGALWGGVLVGILSTIPTTRDAPTTALLIDAGIVVPYVVLLAAHQHVEINRFATWLIEFGGVSGLMMGGAALLFRASMPGGLGSGEAQYIMLGSTAIGVGAGVAAAIAADEFLDDQATASRSWP